MVGTGNPLYTGNNLLQQILNSTETMIFWKDTQRRFVGVNQAFLNYYGFPDQSVLLGKTDEDMGWHSDPDPFANDEWRVLHEGIKTNLVHGKCMARGKERDILASKSPLYSGTEIVGLVGSFIDVTEHFQRLDEIERLHRRLDNVPGGIAVFKYYFDKIICISVNRHLTQMLGASPEDFLDKNLRQLAEVYMEPEERERYFKECPVLNKLAPSAEGTYRFRKGGTAEPVWLHITCQLVREPAGQEFIYCAYTNVDKLINYQNQLQENRRLAEKRYTYALNMLNEGKERNLVSKGRYNFTTNKVLEYRYYIDQAFRVEQATYDDAFDKMMELSYLPQDREVLLKTFSRENILHAFEQGETHLWVSYRRMLNGGEPMWISLTMQTYAVPGTNQVEGISYAYDITMDELRKSIVNNLDGLGYDEIGLVYKGSGFWRCYQYENERRRTSNLPDHQGDWQTEIDRYVREEVVPEQKEHVARELRLDSILEHLSRDRVYICTHSVRLDDGTIRQKQLQFFFLTSVRETIFYSMNDITRQFAHENAQIAKLAEAKLAADRANQSKSNFLSNMSHDIRTPLNGILGFTDLALKEEDEARKQTYLQKVKNSSMLLEELVNDTLELSRIESGKLTLKPELVDGRKLWESLVTALMPAAEMKDIRLETDFSKYPEEMIKVDQLQVKKILLNLISNAIKYTPNGGKVKVDVQALAAEEHGYTRRLIVEDNGIGMYPDFMARMYEPFTQEQRAEAKSVIGTGLGLSIVKRIVDLMQGRITAQSKPGQGTRFTVDLPIEHWDKKPVDLEQMQRDTLHHTEAVKALLEDKKVLLCEDNYLNTEIATLLLKDKKMSVDCAKNGREGVAKFAGSLPHYYDVVLMDIRMPDMDGYEATRAIRKLDREDAGTVPVIAMTANAFAEDIEEARQAGMDDYLTKPINPGILYETLAQQLSKKQL